MAAQASRTGATSVVHRRNKPRAAPLWISASTRRKNQFFARAAALAIRRFPAQFAPRFCSSSPAMRLADRIPLLFNPRAGTLKTMGGRESLLEAASDFLLIATASGEEAEEIARELAASGSPIVAAAGGDGTLNQVVAGLRGSGCALGVVPGGTMNVFARELGLAPNDLEAAFRVVREGKIKELDLFLANERPFLQMAGYGLDARVIELTGDLKDKLGPMAYLAGALQALGEKPPRVTVTTAEGEVHEGAMVLAGNGGLYGGQIRLFAEANHQSGQLDLIVVPPLAVNVFWDGIRSLFQGGIGKGSSPHIRYIQTPSAVLRSAEPVPLELDGELVGSTSEVRLEAAPDRLRVVHPCDSAAAPDDHPAPRAPWPPTA